MASTRREPQRTCIGCRQVDGKSGLVRIVRDPAGGVAVEAPRERLPGRGAYLHRTRACWERALGEADGATISKALRMSPAAGALEGLRRYLETIPEGGLERA